MPYLLEDFGRGENLTVCSTPSSFAKFNRFVSKKARQVVSGAELVGCELPCKETHFKVNTDREDRYRRGDVKIFYPKNDVFVWEEYLVYDLNAIVSGVGGSMGLFLGFSFLGCCEGFLDMGWWR